MRWIVSAHGALNEVCHNDAMASPFVVHFLGTGICTAMGTAMYTDTHTHAYIDRYKETCTDVRRHVCS